MRIGVDVGGTFTDITALDSGGQFHIGKIPSTPDDQSQGLVNGVTTVLNKSGHAAEDVSYLGHGTTVATNTLLELDGSNTALIVTKGFRDVLEIGRQKRPSLYDLFIDKPQILVPRRLVFEVDERMSFQGAPIRPIDERELKDLRVALSEADVDAIAVCFLHSYRNPTHEQLVAEKLQEWFPERYITRSSEVAPEFREYERMSTTVINAFVGPRMHRYLSRLETRSADAGVETAPKIIQSNGGMISPISVVTRPVTTLLSGPSAGVLGAAWVANNSGYNDVVTFDMGGTSTDVCLVRNGEATVTSERAIDGYVVRTPAVNVHTVGAGGGSIAKVDDAGALNVGPQSAGAVPGPAAYAMGGKKATVTDANVVLKRQNPEQILGEGLHLDLDAGQNVMDQVADDLGISGSQAALGVLRMANSHMARAVRKVSVDNGDDPRDLALIAYGGAGPLHAIDVAKEVGIKTVLVPLYPGTLSALGLLVSEVRTEILRSCLLSLTKDISGIREVIDNLRSTADVWFDTEQIPNAQRATEYILEMRYKRQNFELPVEIGTGRVGPDDVEEIATQFHTVHRKMYGFEHSESELTVVNVKVIASQLVDTPIAPVIGDRTSGNIADAQLGTRPVLFEEGAQDTSVYSRELLRANDTISGPAIFEQEDSTVVLPPGYEAVVDAYGTLIMEAKN